MMKTYYKVTAVLSSGETRVVENAVLASSNGADALPVSGELEKLKAFGTIESYTVQITSQVLE